MSKALIPLIILLNLSLLIQPYPISSSSDPLAEDLRLFVTKDSIVVSARLSGGNITLRGLETTSLNGVNSYKLVACYVTEWLPEFYILGDEGYNVLPLSPPPKEGLTLIVNAQDDDQADSAAQAIGRVMKTAFIRIGSRDHEYIYYSNCNYRFISQILLSALPNIEGGFTNLLKQIFLEKSLQFIVLEASRSQIGFSTQLTLQYAESRSLSSTFDLNSVLPGFSNLTTSKGVSQNRVEVVFADALISSTSLSDAEVVNLVGNLSSKISFRVAEGQKPPLSKIELTYYPPFIRVERVVDEGVVEAAEGRDTVEVTLRVENVAPPNSIPAEVLTIEESWWRGKFELVSGRTLLEDSTLKAGEKKEIHYVIRLNEKTPSDLYVAGETTPISYRYKIGDKIWEGRAYPNDVILVLNKYRPSLLVTAEPKDPSPLKAENELTLKITNVGMRSANNLTVTLGEGVVASEPALIPLKDWTVQVPVRPENLIQSHREVRVSVGWIDEDGEKKVLTNTVPIRFIRSTLGAPKVTVNQIVDAFLDESGVVVNGVVKASVTLANRTLIELSAQLPEGFELTGGNFTVSGRSIKVSSEFNKSVTEQIFNYSLKSSRAASFIQAPISAEIRWGSFILKAASNSYAYATGLKVTQEVSKPSAFVGSTSDVKVMLVNLGPFPVYDLKVRSLNYSYVEAEKADKIIEVLEAGQTLTFNFRMRYLNVGGYDHLPIEGGFVFSAQNQTLKMPKFIFYVEQPIKLSLTTPTSLTEKQPATLTLNLTNPSSLTVYDVEAHVVISGAESPDTSIVLKASELRSKQTLNQTVQITPSSVLSLKITSKINFSFEGEVLQGESLSAEIPVAENLHMRYTLATVIGVLAIIVTAYLSRRKIEKETQAGEQRKKTLGV